MQFTNLHGVESSGNRSAQSLAVQSSLRQTGAGSFAKNLPFELGKDRQQSGHSTTGWRGEIQGFSQRHEADAEMLQLLQSGEQVGH